MNELDDPSRADQLVTRIQQKLALRRLYLEVYAAYQAVLDRCPREGVAIELGAGASFVKDVIPDLTTADILPYNTVDMTFDACHMPFANNSLRFIGMQNVLHHIPDAEAFFSECQRCLMTGGRVLITDQYPGWLAHWILKYAHHEAFDPTAREWSFPSSGPLSGANGALAWIVFFRDRARFQQQFSELQIERIDRHTPLRYWLSGGLKSWSLIPNSCWSLACRMDAILLRCSPQWASFMNVELVKQS
jgi:SAM-dependent methyltransferase